MRENFTFIPLFHDNKYTDFLHYIAQTIYKYITEMLGHNCVGDQFRDKIF